MKNGTPPSEFAEIVARMAHDLRAPLNSIIGFSELMYGGRAGPIAKDQHEYLGDILASARQLLRMLNDVIDLAKGETGRIEFFPEPVDVAQVAADASSAARKDLADKSATIWSDIDPTLTNIVLDPDKLRQVIYNYVSSALRGAHRGDRITVRAAPEGPATFRIEVERDGEMISDEVPLLVARRLVELQGGRAGTVQEGRASRLFAVLPRVQRDAE